MRGVYVAGVGMTRFGKTGLSLKELAADAVEGALTDAGIGVSDVECAFVANAAGGLLVGQEMIRGQVLLRPLGFTRIPIINVENACASASTAAYLGAGAIATSQHEIVLCLGVEKMTTPVEKERALAAIGSATDVEAECLGTEPRARSAFMDLYADLTRDYMDFSGATPRHFATVAAKNQLYGSLNPFAQYGSALTEEEILASRQIVGPLTLFMCSPISDGAAAVVLASPKRCRQLGLRARPRVRASTLVSGTAYDPRRLSESSAGFAASLAYEQAAIGPDDLDVAEVHDATASAELMAYEELSLAPNGEGPRLVENGTTSLAGSIPVNVSGGLLCRGHPLGATGLAQIVESTWQLRGLARERQVEDARVAITHNGGGWVDGDSAATSIHILSRN